MHISKQDKDTMLITSSTGDCVYVVTYNYCLRRRLESLVQKHPKHYYFVKYTKDGCATFRISKPCISVKFTEPTE